MCFLLLCHLQQMESGVTKAHGGQYFKTFCACLLILCLTGFHAIFVEKECFAFFQCFVTAECSYTFRTFCRCFLGWFKVYMFTSGLNNHFRVCFNCTLNPQKTAKSKNTLASFPTVWSGYHLP